MFVVSVRQGVNDHKVNLQGLKAMKMQPNIISELPAIITVQNAPAIPKPEGDNNKPVLLSLYSGTNSICKPFLNAGWIVHTLDILNTHHPTICIDILRWDYKRWSHHHHIPDVIFAGPECKNYSQARTKAKKPRNLHYADLLVTKLLEIIDYFHKKNPLKIV